MNENSKKILADGVKKLNLTLSDAQKKSLEDYLALLLKWNRVFNLTAIRNEEDGVRKHLLDCLGVVSFVKSLMTEERPYRLVDVGSGGGLPAVVLAVCIPELEVLSVDAVAKKTTFVTQASAELRLKNLHAKHTRIEDLDDRFDFVTCRAFASLKLFTDLTEHCIKDGGRWIAMKGKRPDEEIRELGGFVSVDEIIPVEIPGLSEERTLLLMHKKAE